MHRSARKSLFLALLVLGCPKATPVVTPEKPKPLTEQEQARAAERAIGEELAQVLMEEDERLWEHFTTGAPLDLRGVWTGHEALLSPKARDTVRNARVLAADDPHTLGALEAALLGERTARVTADAAAEADIAFENATFVSDGKTLHLRDLNRLLSNEKSAVKRKVVYTASLPAMAQAGAARTRWAKKLDEAVKADGFEPQAAAELLLGRSLADSEAEAMQLIDSTRAEWQGLLAGLSVRDLQLPVDKLTRADFPRLLRGNTPADVRFGKGEVPVRATELLGQLGLYGAPGLTLDWSTSPRKLPIPFTVAPRGPTDVRLSYLPSGGLRDMSTLLDELGRALAHHGAAPRFDSERLGSPAWADATGELFAQLAWDPVWLAASGIPAEQAGAAGDEVHAGRLYVARKAAGEFLAQLRSREQPPEKAAEIWRSTMSLALGVPVAADESARIELDASPLFRQAELVHEYMLAQQLHRALILYRADWWKAPEAARFLAAYWAPGSAGAKPPEMNDGGVVMPEVKPWRPAAWDKPRSAPVAADAGFAFDAPNADAGISVRDAGAVDAGKSL
ncbi:MAG: hypothetical protein QM723_19665 [Myxococcaceae bacterium]